MILREEAVYWLKCDGKGCGKTYGKPSEPEMSGCEPYDWRGQLQKDAKDDGWRFTEEEDEFGDEYTAHFCAPCALKKELIPLTPIQQAALMHGKQPFIPYAHGGFKR